MGKNHYANYTLPNIDHCTVSHTKKYNCDLTPIEATMLQTHSLGLFTSGFKHMHYLTVRDATFLFVGTVIFLIILQHFGCCEEVRIVLTK